MIPGFPDRLRFALANAGLTPAQFDLRHVADFLEAQA